MTDSASELESRPDGSSSDQVGAASEPGTVMEADEENEQSDPPLEDQERIADPDPTPEVLGAPRHDLEPSKLPKPPSTAFFLFGAQQRALEKETGGSALNAKEIGARWQNLSVAERHKYEDETAQARKEYRSQLAKMGLSEAEARALRKKTKGSQGSAKGTPSKLPLLADLTEEQKKILLKPPRSAYFVFAADQRPKVASDHPDMKLVEVTKELGKRWSALSSEQKTRYEDTSSQEKEAYSEFLHSMEISFAQAADLRKKLKSGSGDSSAELELALPLARVKAVMAFDPDFKRASREATHLISKSTELFIGELAKLCIIRTQARSRSSKTIQSADFYSTLQSSSVLDFLLDAIPLPSSTNRSTKPSAMTFPTVPAAAGTEEGEDAISSTSREAFVSMFNEYDGPLVDLRAKQLEAEEEEARREQSRTSSSAAVSTSGRRRTGSRKTRGRTAKKKLGKDVELLDDGLVEAQEEEMEMEESSSVKAADSGRRPRRPKIPIRPEKGAIHSFLQEGISMADINTSRIEKEQRKQRRDQLRSMVRMGKRLHRHRQVGLSEEEELPEEEGSDGSASEGGGGGGGVVIQDADADAGLVRGGRKRANVANLLEEAEDEGEMIAASADPGGGMEEEDAGDLMVPNSAEVTFEDVEELEKRGQTRKPVYGWNVMSSDEEDSDDHDQDVRPIEVDDNVDPLEEGEEENGVFGGDEQTALGGSSKKKRRRRLVIHDDVAAEAAAREQISQDQLEEEKEEEAAVWDRFTRKG